MIQPPHISGLGEYLKMICNLSNCFIIIDEANDLDRRLWPYLKRIIDAGVPIVVEDFVAEYKDIEQEAIEQIYMATKGDMRKFKEIYMYRLQG